MKKSLIALAVLGAAAGAAQAQSSVSLYGIVDEYFVHSETTIAGVKTKSNGLESGGVSGSRWGLKGSEDLGGGLKALFVVESGFNADNGTGNSGPNRQSYVGLGGGFGTVTFGNVYSAMDDIAGYATSGFDSALSAGNSVLAVTHGAGVGGYQGRPRNAIKYVSPSYSGFSGGFSYSLDETTAKKGNQADLSLSYGAGPIAANFAYEVQGDSFAKDDLKLTALNGSYDFGMAKLLAGYGQSKLAAEKSTDFQIGVDVPLSSALTLSGGYAQSKDNAAAGNQKRTGFGLAAAYGLSKRTTAYAGFRTAKAKTAGVTDGKENAVAVGLKHTF